MTRVLICLSNAKIKFGKKFAIGQQNMKTPNVSFHAKFPLHSYNMCIQPHMDVAMYLLASYLQCTVIGPLLVTRWMLSSTSIKLSNAVQLSGQVFCDHSTYCS